MRVVFGDLPGTHVRAHHDKQLRQNYAHRGLSVGSNGRKLIAFLDKVASDWGGPLDIDQRIPSMANDSRFAHWWARFLRQGATPKALLSLARANIQIDIRQVLPAVRVPALILHANANRIIEAGHGRYLAGAVRGAKLVIYPARDHVPLLMGRSTSSGMCASS